MGSRGNLVGRGRGRELLPLAYEAQDAAKPCQVRRHDRYRI
jgi:hypothetical protein